MKEAELLEVALPGHPGPLRLTGGLETLRMTAESSEDNTLVLYCQRNGVTIAGRQGKARQGKAKAKAKARQGKAKDHLPQA